MSGSCRVAVLAAALGLAACGRAGPLEPPPGPAAPTAQFTASDGTPALHNEFFELQGVRNTLFQPLSHACAPGRDEIDEKAGTIALCCL